jgi:hypothetical protein
MIEGIRLQLVIVHKYGANPQSGEQPISECMKLQQRRCNTNSRITWSALVNQMKEEHGNAAGNRVFLPPHSSRACRVLRNRRGATKKRKKTKKTEKMTTQPSNRPEFVFSIFDKDSLFVVSDSDSESDSDSGSIWKTRQTYLFLDELSRGQSTCSCGMPGHANVVLLGCGSVGRALAK